MGGNVTVHAKDHVNTRTGGGAQWNPMEVKDGSLLVDASPDGYVITQHDTTDDPDGPFVGMRFDAAGTVEFESGSGDTLTVTAVAGEYYPGTVVRVNATNTTLTNAQIIGFKRA